MLRRVVWQEFTDVSEVLTACIRAITLMLEVVSTSETLVNICQTTRRIIPEDSHLLNHNLVKITEDLGVTVG
jgi:hypothetical protein